MNKFTDFDVLPLVPHMQSKNGTMISTGDIKGDGLDDFYVLDSAASNGRFFIQATEGTFMERPLNQDINPEDMGSLLFNADVDGDKDLYEVSWGSKFEK